MTGGDAPRHCTDLLAEYAAGALEAPSRAAAEEHLEGCPSCRAELEGWTAVAAATAGPEGPPPSPAAMVHSVLTRSALAPRPQLARRRGARFAAQLLRAELRLVRPSVWLASLLVMACAVALAAGGDDGAGSTMLSLVAPLIAAAGVAGVYGPARDPAFEALAVTVTSPRLVFLARVTLVFAYDLALAVAASAVVGVIAPGISLVDLVTGWLGPMTLLAALSLLLAMWIGPNVSIAVAGSLWALRVLTVGVPGLEHGWLATAMRAAWATNPGSVAATLALLATALVLSRRRLQPGDGWYRPVA
jgi:anti-sigma factor RsiW